MTVSEVHLREVAREILIKVLQDGIIPSGEELAKLTKQRTEGLNLAQPRFTQGEPGVDYGEAASASKFNRLSKEIVGDLKVLYNSYLFGEQSLANSLDRTLLETQRLSRKVKSLLSRVNRLLLTTEKTGGLLNIVGDGFSDVSLIDTDRTTAHIDLEGQTIHTEYFRSDELSPMDAIDVSRITADKITITPLDQRVRRSPGTRDSSLTDILSPRDQPWMYTVSTTSSDPVPVEVRIDCSAAANPGTGLVKTYKITLDPFITNNSILVAVQHSRDGVTWADIPVTDPIRKIQSPTVYLVDGLEFRYIRVIMTRDTYTRLGPDGEYIHDFGIRRLGIHSVKNFYNPESVLISKPHIVLDQNGNRKKFSKASLSVACEHVEPDTEIDYFIAFLDQTLTEGEFQRVVPLNREDISGPQIAEVSTASLLVTREIDTTSPAFPGDSLAENVLLESYVSTNNIELWRNVGSNRRFYTVRQSDGRIVEDGWRYDGSQYSTYIYIDEPGGQNFDFGPSPISIDGVSLTGEVRLSEGIHLVKVREENWYSLEGLMGVTEFDRATKQFRGTQTKYGDTGFTIPLDDPAEVDQNYRVIDPLYPYNHKLLIEGLHYSGNFEQDIVRQKYKGAARYAAHLGQKIADTDMERNIDSSDYSKFALIKADDGAGGVTTRIMVKWKELEGETPREQFLTAEKIPDSFAEGLIFKAVLKTTNPRRSASLDGYEIKIAE